MLHYTVVYWVIALCFRKKQCAFIAENATSELSVSHNLFVGEESCLSVDGCWLIRLVAAESGGGYGNFLK